jgi:hypothetical protein
VLRGFGYVIHYKDTACNVFHLQGGGYNMGVSGGGAAGASGQENYIKSLQQQIKILELEIAYLKKLPGKEGEKTGTSTQLFKGP